MLRQRFQFSLATLILVTLWAGMALWVVARHERVWTLREEYDFRRSNDSARLASLSPSGRYMAAVELPRTLSVYDLSRNTRSAAWTVELARTPRDIGFYCEGVLGLWMGGSRCYFAAQTGAAIKDGPRLQELLARESEIPAGDAEEFWSPDRMRMLCVKNTIFPAEASVQLFDDTGCICIWSDAPPLLGGVEVTSVSVRACAFTPDSRRFATAHYDDAIRIHDAKDGRVLTTVHTGDFNRRIVFSGDGNTMAVIHHGKMTLWDRYRPEWTWGHLCRVEVWFFSLCSVALLIRAARRIFRACASIPACQ